eukprot:scaffold8174_cov286-Pinguiococcus_pyrenoidosus.AAC.2
MADATEPELAEPSDAEEAAHFEEIVMSFCEYGLYMSLEAQRRANALSLLPASARELLPEDAFQNIRRFATECSALNAKFLSAVASEVALGVGFDISGPNVVLDRVHELTLAGVRHVQHALAQAKGQQARGDAERLDSNVALDGLRFSAADVRTAPHQQRKVHQTLHSIVREWTTEGEQERVECFQPLLEELRRHLPVTPDNLLQQKVLVPGNEHCACACALTSISAWEDAPPIPKDLLPPRMRLGPPRRGDCACGLSSAGQRVLLSGATCAAPPEIAHSWRRQAFGSQPPAISALRCSSCPTTS